MTTQARQKWIVGFDGSDNARRALEWAAHTAKGREVAIDVISAWRRPYTGVLPIPADQVHASSAELVAAITGQTTEVVDEIRAATGAELDLRVELGGASEVLLRAADDADLLVVGSRGRGGFAQLVLGSVGLQTSAHSSTPTLIVPESAEPHGLHRVIVGVDGSANSRAALVWAHNFVDHRAEITAVQSWDVPFIDGPSAETVLRTMNQQARQDFASLIADTEAEIGVPGRFTKVFTAGHAGDILCEHAKHADLLVLGARGAGGLLSGLGSLSSWVLHHLVGPTAIVPSSTTD